METLLSNCAQVLDAGLTVPAFAQGAGASDLPASARELLQRTDLVPSEALFRLGVLDHAGKALVVVGERTGRLPEALRHVVARMRERRKAMRALQARLLQPLLLLTVAGLVLPLPSWVTSGPAAYLRTAAPVVGVVVVLGFLVARLPSLPPGSTLRSVLSRLALYLPLARGVVLHQSNATFTDVLSTCLAAGLPAREALVLAADATHDARLLDAQATWVATLDRGATLAEVLGIRAVFPGDVVARVAVGEQSGRLPEVLRGCAVEQEDLAQRAAQRAIALVGAVVFTLAAGYAARTIISTWTNTLQQRGAGIDDI
ncbi:MAG: type II secretion system F family protein [Myxococcota bacterium]